MTLVYHVQRIVNMAMRLYRVKYQVNGKWTLKYDNEGE